MIASDHQTVSLSNLTKMVLRTLGEMIKCARLERGLSQTTLAARLNVSRYTVIALEKGNPQVAIGTVFEAAVIVGIQLLGEDKYALEQLSTTVAHLTSILPKRTGRVKKRIADDDF